MALDNPAFALYESLDSYAQIQELIDNGVAEHGQLECKAPASPQLNSGLQAQLAKSLSGFSNAGGGVILWGVATDRNPATSLDLLTQIQPVGNCKKLANEIDRNIPMLAVPVIQAPASRILYENEGDTKGVIVTYVPPAPGDPVRSLTDNHFYLRANDQHVIMPYELIKRMFASAEMADIRPVFDGRIVTRDAAAWRIPILVTNHSSATPERGKVMVEILNPDACDKAQSPDMNDASAINPGTRVFSADLNVVYRGMNSVIGHLVVSMKKGIRLKRVLRLEIELYADRMRARRWVMRVQLAEKGFSVTEESSEYVY